MIIFREAQEQEGFNSDADGGMADANGFNVSFAYYFPKSSHEPEAAFKRAYCTRPLCNLNLEAFIMAST